MRAENRRRALTPEALPSATHIAIRRRFLGTFGALSVASVVLVIIGRSPWFLLLAIPGALAMYTVARESLLLLRARKWAERTGRAGVLITSDSPHWRPYIYTNWLPTLGDRVSVLNWSHHAGWRPNVETALFEGFAGRRNYCPAIIILRCRGRPFVFRFYRAFQARKHGNEAPLRQLEAEAFRILESVRSNQTLERPGGAGRSAS